MGNVSDRGITTDCFCENIRWGDNNWKFLSKLENVSDGGITTERSCENANKKDEAISGKGFRAHTFLTTLISHLPCILNPFNCTFTTIMMSQGPMRDATLEFRLSVYNAKPADEGLYTCTTPKNMVIEYIHDHDLWFMMITLPPQSHSVQLKVVDIQCSPLDVPKGFSWWRDHGDAGIHDVDVTKGLLYDDWSWWWLMMNTLLIVASSTSVLMMGSMIRED